MRGAWALLIVVLAGMGVLAVGSCSKRAAPATVVSRPWPTPVKAVVSIPPLKGLVEPLLPPGSTVKVLIPPGASEHGFEIPPAQVREAIGADLLVWIGGMEPAVETLSKANPRDGRTDVRLADALKIEVHDEHGHDHAHDHHDHGDGPEGDPHVWLDPIKASEISRAVAAQVQKIRPRSAGTTYAAADAAFKVHFDALETLDRAFKEGLAGGASRTIVVGHDAYGWLAKRYGLTTVAISGLTAAEPTAGDLQKAKEAVRANGLKAVFTEPQISDRAARSIAEATGVKVLSLDPLGDGDYFKMMYANLGALQQALGIEPKRESGSK